MVDAQILSPDDLLQASESLQHPDACLFDFIPSLRNEVAKPSNFVDENSE